MVLLLERTGSALAISGYIAVVVLISLCSLPFTRRLPAPVSPHDTR
jgi:hypothetical protein